MRPKALRFAYSCHTEGSFKHTRRCVGRNRYKPEERRHGELVYGHSSV